METTLLTPQALFDKSLEALGGPQVAARVLSITGIADCVSPNGPYVTELYSARPDRLVFKQIHPGRAPFVAVINGPYAWSTEPTTNAISEHTPQIAVVLQSHDVLMLPLVWAERFKDFTLAPVADFAGKPCVTLHASDALDLPCSLYFETDTYQIAGLTLTNPLSADGATVQIAFTEWHRVNDLRLPLRVVITDPTGDFIFVFREVCLNALDAQMFAIPDAIQNSSPCWSGVFR